LHVIYLFGMCLSILVAANTVEISGESGSNM
jgi:hypothetical protein